MCSWEASQPTQISVEWVLNIHGNLTLGLTYIHTYKWVNTNIYHFKLLNLYVGLNKFNTLTCLNIQV